MLFRQSMRTGVLIAILTIFCLWKPATSHSDEAVGQSVKFSVDWEQTVSTSKTVPSMLVVTHPLLRKRYPLENAAPKAIEELNAKYVRYLGYFPYPRLTVAELKAPTKEETFWDFS